MYFLSNISYLSSIFGISPLAVYFALGSYGLYAGIKIRNDFKESQKEKLSEKYNKMVDKKKEIEVDLFDEDKERENKQIENNYNNMKAEQKERELKNYNLVENASFSKLFYKGIKVDNQHQMLLGYDCEDNPVWGTDTNYVIAGTTGCGKTRKLYVLLLNWLVNKQGDVFIGDLKGTDFKFFKNCRNVKVYVDDLINIKEPVEEFKKEYDYRRELFNEKGYIDIEDYNSKNKEKLKEFMLLIDEYADISDCYKDHNGKPVGVYADIIQLARKCRALGGRIVLGTQRPSVDVICGTLKVNCSIVGMKTINALNSKIMIDAEGCERLAKREALTVIDGNLIKVFSYQLPDETLFDCISKLR